MGEIFAGRYELIDPIARGGMGAVWRAWDHRRRRYVAAKVLQQSDAHALLRFVREQALRIDHPHVLAPASWAADDDKVLFTMDLVGGGSLAHVIGDYGPLPPRFVCILLDQLLAGLAAVHAEGVVHRDIKPANILLEATGTGRPHLRLSDFGISMRKGEPRLTETDYVVGTPGYFAPEQLMGAEPDFPADLFAVGLVALYLLDGRKPDARTLIEHFASHGTPTAPKGVPEPLWQVVAGLLQPDPQARFRTATGARKALIAAAEILPDPAPDEDPVEIFDQLGPLPPGCTPSGPQRTPPPPGAAEAPVVTEVPAAIAETEAAEENGVAEVPVAAEERGTAEVPVAADESRVTNEPVVANEARVTRRSEEPARPNSSTVDYPATDYPVASSSAKVSAAQPTGQRHQGAQSPAASGRTAAASQAAMSQTGSFHLPPPQRQAVSRACSTPPPTPSPPASGEPASAPLPEAVAPSFPVPPHSAYPTPGVLPNPSPSPAAAAGHPLPPPRGHAAHAPAAPDPAAPVSYAPHPPQTAPTPGARKRPGPPPKVTVPVLVLALICFAVGIWALTQT